MPLQRRDRGVPLSREGIKRVHQGIRELGLSKKQFAKRGHLTLKTLERALRGEPIDAAGREAIAQALGIDQLDLTDPHGTRFLDWQLIRQNSLEQLPPLLTDLLADRVGRALNQDNTFVNLTLYLRQGLSSYPSINRIEQGSQFYEPGVAEVAAVLDVDGLIEEFIESAEATTPIRKHAVLLGPTGAGKTIVLRAFLNKGINHPNVTILYVPLYELQNRGIEDYLLSRWLQKALKRATGTVSEREKAALVGRFREQQVILLIDGENETNAVTLRLLQQQLEGWVGLAHIVLACRPNLWNFEQSPLSYSFEVYCLSPLHYGGVRQVDQVRQFIEVSLRHEPALGIQLRSKLDQPDQHALRDLVRNPLLLTILCYVWERWRTLPPTLNQLYTNFVRIICGYEGTFVDTTDFFQEPLLQTAGIVARQAIEMNSPFRLEKSSIYQILQAEDLDINQFHQLKQIGLLNLVGTALENPDEEIYVFLHPTVQQWLAAYTINDETFFLGQSFNKLLQGQGLFNSQLFEVYLFWLGRRGISAERKRVLIQQLFTFECGIPFYHYRSVFLAAAGLAEFYEPDLTRAIVDQLNAWLYTEMECIRWASLLALLSSQTTEAIAILIEFSTSNPASPLCLQTITLLGRTRLQHYEQVKVALLRLIESDDLAVQFLAGESLIALEPSNLQIQSRHIHLLVTTQTPFLSQVHDRLFRPSDLEFAIIYNDSDLNGTQPFQFFGAERLWCSLGKGNNEAIRLLFGYLESSSPEFAIQNAAIGLGELGTGQISEIKALVTLIGATENEQTKEIAISSLGKFGIDFSQIVDALLRTGVETVEEEQIVGMALAQLSPQGQPFIVLNSSDELDLPPDEVVKQFFEALILGWLTSAYDFEQRYKIKQILQYGVEDKVLIQICTEQLVLDQEVATRWLGVSLIGEIGTGADSEVDLLEQFLESETFKPLRRAASKSLAQLLAKRPNAEQQILEALSHCEDEETKLWLSFQLGKSIPKQTLRAVENLANLIANSPFYFDEFVFLQENFDIFGYNPSPRQFTGIVRQAAHQVKQLLSSKNANIAVAQLSNCLDNKTYQQEPGRHLYVLELLWQCAYLISPAEFSRAQSENV